MKFDLNTLNTKPQIIIDTKINFPKEDLEKAKILKMDEVSVKGQINNNKEESILNLTIKGKMTLPCNLTLDPVDYPFSIEIEENLNEIIENSQKTIDIFTNNMGKYINGNSHESYKSKC